MTSEEYEAAVRGALPEDFDPMVMVLGLAGEIGELCVAEEDGNLADEIGDVWWYVTVIRISVLKTCPSGTPETVVEIPDRVSGYVYDDHSLTLGLFIWASKLAEITGRFFGRHVDPDWGEVLFILRMIVDALRPITAFSGSRTADIWEANAAKLRGRYPNGRYPNGFVTSGSIH